MSITMRYHQSGKTWTAKETVNGKDHTFKIVQRKDMINMNPQPTVFDITVDDGKATTHDSLYDAMNACDAALAQIQKAVVAQDVPQKKRAKKA